MKKRFLAIVLIALTLLTSCRYVVIEDRPAAEEMKGPETESSLPTDSKDTAHSKAEDVPPGSQGDVIASVQEMLLLYGFMNGKADGIYGSGTEVGVKALNRHFSENAFLASRFSGFDPESGTLNGEVAEYLLAGHYDPVMETLSSGSKGSGVRRIQTRLMQLDYLTTPADGEFGGNTKDALSYFQKRNDLPETGIADYATQKKLFSSDAKKSDRPIHMYLLKISTSDQRVYAYQWENGGYNKLVRTMICSTGTYETPTPLGTFRAAGACGRWYYFKKFDCWAQYAYRITGGILFHSVIYSEKDTSTLRQSTVNNLGSRASHGCIRLKVEDAKWIYNNCPAGTTVTVV